MSQTRINSSDALIHYNRLEKDIQKVANAFNYPLNLFLTSKYEVKNNHIYATGTKYRVFAFCVTLFAITLCFFRIFVPEQLHVTNTQFKSEISSGPYMINLTTYLIGFKMLFLLDYIHKNNNVLIILMIQALYKTIDVGESIKSFIIWSWISNFTIICIHFILNVMFCATVSSYSIGLVLDHVADLLCLPFDLNIVLAIRIIILLKKYLDKWIEDFVTISNDNGNNDEYLKLFGIYGNILKTYILYNDIFKVLVLYRIVITFQRALCYVSFMVNVMNQFSEKGAIPIIRTLNFILYLIKDLVLVITHCFYCDQFYEAVEEAETASIQLMKNKNHTKHQKQLFKNVRQANRTFSKMSACGLFCVDASLPMNLMQVIAQYVITQVQFYFL